MIKVTVATVLLSLPIALSSCSAPVGPTQIENKAPPALTEENSKVPEVEPYRLGSWERSINRESVRQAAFAQAEAFFDSRPAPAPFTVEPHFGPNLPSPTAKCATEYVETVFNKISMESVVDDGESSILLIAETANNQDWIVETARSIESDWVSQSGENWSVEFPDWLDMARSPSSFTNGYGEHNAIVLIPNTADASSCEKIERLVYHEAFHSLTARIDGKSLVGFAQEDMHHMGRWFREGTADFFAQAIIATERGSEYVGVSALIEPGEMVKMSSMENGYRVYIVGHFVVEYIVANVGVEPIFEIYQAIGEGKSFEDALEEGIGIPVEEFYDIVENMEIDMRSTTF